MIRRPLTKNNLRVNYTPRYSLRSAVITSDLLLLILVATFISSLYSTGFNTSHDVDRLAVTLTTFSLYCFWRFK